MFALNGCCCKFKLIEKLQECTKFLVYFSCSRMNHLLSTFSSRKQNLFSSGGAALLEEIMAYACFKKEESVNNIIRDGAAVKTSLYNYLGCIVFPQAINLLTISINHFV